MPIWFIIWMILSFAYLGHETKWLTVRLESYGYQLVNIKSIVDNWSTEFTMNPRRFIGAESIYQNAGNGHMDGYRVLKTLQRVSKLYGLYDICLSPNTDTLCGKKWLDKHWNDLADYQPKVEMNIGGVRYKMTIKQPSILKDVMRVNKLTKKQKLAYVL
ncbi:hypothetical protein LCGC14_0955680 [marine sediment metagenome]|uniref:Uncharacterized protein n=1 Tax=marine sediment metagenome TaxID=412755 RepID=A0A0F9NKL1_9ZZZZ